MPNITHLLEKDSLPDFIPRHRRVVWPETEISGGGDIGVYQTEGETLISRDPTPAVERIEQTSTVTDPFLHMDFRVSWSNNVATINRGRIYYCVWSPPANSYVPRSTIIPADEVPLVLTQGDTDATVYLSIPWAQDGNPSFFNNGEAIGSSYPEYTYNHAGGTRLFSTLWTGLDITETARRMGLAATEPKFAVAQNSRAATPIRNHDYMIQLACVDFAGGARPVHFGSVFLPQAFEQEYFGGQL